MAMMKDDETPQFTQEQITARLTANINPDSDQMETSAYIRSLIVNVAIDLNESVADSREKSVALTHLEDALMWANKAIMK